MHDNRLRKNNILLSIFSLLAAVILLVGTVFAWFTLYDKTNSLNFRIAKIDSEIRLYRINDNNLNGIFPLPANDKTILLDNQGREVFYATDTNASPNVFLSAESAGITLLPTQVISYEVNIINKSDASNNVRFEFQGITQSESGFTSSNISALRAFSVRMGEVVSEHTITYSNKMYLQNNIQLTQGFYTFGSSVTAADGFTIPGRIQSQSNEKSFFIQYQLESYEELQNNFSNAGGELITMQDYQALAAGAKILIPTLRIYLEVLFSSISPN